MAALLCRVYIHVCVEVSTAAAPATPSPSNQPQTLKFQAVKTAGGAPSGVMQYWYFDINHWEQRLFPQTTPANVSAIASGTECVDKRVVCMCVCVHVFMYWSCGWVCIDTPSIDQSHAQPRP